MLYSEHPLLRHVFQSIPLGLNNFLCAFLHSRAKELVTRPPGNYPQMCRLILFTFSNYQAQINFLLMSGLEHLAPGLKALYNPMKMNPNIKRPKSGISFMCAGNQAGIKGHILMLLSPVAVMKKSKFH